MVGSRIKFAEVVRAARKSKAIIGAIGLHSKRTRRTKEIIMLPHLPPHPIIEESAHSQPKSSAMGVSASIPVPEPSTVAPTSTKPIPTNVGVNSLWPPSIQQLVLTRMPSLLKDLSLAILLTENALRPGVYRRLNEVKTDKLFGNVMHPDLQSALYAYMAKERNKVLRWEFGAQEMDKRLLAEECSRLKTRVVKVEGTMRETLELVNKL